MTEQAPVLLVQDTIGVVCGALAGHWSKINQYIGIQGVDVVVLLLILLHVLYFVFFWKGEANNKLEN